MTALGRLMNEKMRPSGRQAIPTPPNIYHKNTKIRDSLKGKTFTPQTLKKIASILKLQTTTGVFSRRKQKFEGPFHTTNT